VINYTAVVVGVFIGIGFGSKEVIELCDRKSAFAT
jgi:hypothetical protein